jgi:hypothetical protein
MKKCLFLVIMLSIFVTIVCDHFIARGVNRVHPGAVYNVIGFEQKDGRQLIVCRSDKFHLFLFGERQSFAKLDYEPLSFLKAGDRFRVTGVNSLFTGQYGARDIIEIVSR